MRRSRLAKAAVVFTVTIGLSSGSGVWGQTGPTDGGPSPGVRLQAELLKTIDASHARVGDAVTARTVTSMELDGAKFPTGAIVKGHVAEADPSRLLLVFDSVEVNKDAPVAVPLSLRAIMMPGAATTAQSQSTDAQISPRAQAGGANKGVDPGTPTQRGDMLRSPEAAAQDSADTIFEGSHPVPVTPRTVETRNGGVIGLPGIQMMVSADPKAGATFQAEKDHKLKLEKGLQLMFVVSK